MKCCTKCHILKPFSSFNKRYENLAYWCKSCMYQAKSKWVLNNKERVILLQKRRRKTNPLSFKLMRRRSTLKKYGLTIQKFDELLKAQENRCAICRTDKPRGFANQWAVDHCHRTGIVRGILCTDCNKGLGHFKDNISLFNIAVVYLSKTGANL